MHDLELAAKLNLRQRCWIELLKDYDLTFEYHLGKANVVVDALSRKFVIGLASLQARVRLVDDGSLLAELMVQPIFLPQIMEAELKDIRPRSKVHIQSSPTTIVTTLASACLVLRLSMEGSANLQSIGWSLAKESLLALIWFMVQREKSRSCGATRDLEVEPNLSYEEDLIRILDR
ncbi:integrase [Gossypium australe]|uniref:Integrase n=1 Tax=Gossypium australe TaxID=47621 RepID=A0A5B6VLF8_9ROSI|nr:integrase [Gossypium australe]